QAERSFMMALELSKDTRIAKAGIEIAKKGREKAEKEAAAEIAKGTSDPIAPAKVLQASMLIDQASKLVKSAETALVARAKKAAQRPDDAEPAAVLDALVLLENASSDVIEGMRKADTAYAKGIFDEAEAAYESIDGSRAADLGHDLARQRRVAVAKADLE